MSRVEENIRRIVKDAQHGDLAAMVAGFTDRDRADLDVIGGIDTDDYDRNDQSEDSVVFGEQLTLRELKIAKKIAKMSRNP